MKPQLDVLPPPQRRFGYYAMPLLYGYDVIGWANVALRDGVLDAEFGFVGARPKGAAFRRGLDAELAAMEGFLGKEKAPAAQAYGHIPGALNIDSAEFYDSKTNRLKSREQLAAIANAVPAGAVVNYCNTGHWAATDWYVMHELLGRKEARLYAGSMVEWTSNASRPVESSRTKWDDLKKALGLGS